MRIVAFLLLLTVLFSCGNNNVAPTSNWLQPNGKIKVLSSIAMIDDIVKQVGGEHVDTIPMINGELDPHSYQLVKGDDEKLGAADVIFYNGLGLEHGPSLQRYLQTHPKAIALGNRIKADNPDRILYLNGQIDPHIWMDISLWSQIVPQIVEALSEVDPAHANEYQHNGQRVLEDMASVHEDVIKILHQIPDDKRYLVTSHDAFNYFTKAYLATSDEKTSDSWQKRFAAPEGLAPDSQLSSVDIQAIINHLAQFQIHVLFPESNVSKDSIKKIISAGREKGLNLKIAEVALYGDAMGPHSYLEMIRHNANTLEKNLH